MNWFYSMCKKKVIIFKNISPQLKTISLLPSLANSGYMIEDNQRCTILNILNEDSSSGFHVTSGGYVLNGATI